MKTLINFQLLPTSWTWIGSTSQKFLSIAAHEDLLNTTKNGNSVWHNSETTMFTYCI